MFLLSACTASLENKLVGNWVFCSIDMCTITAFEATVTYGRARAASHGCIRLANWDTARVKDVVSLGNTVIIF